MFRYAAKASLFLLIVLLTNIVSFFWVSQYQTTYLAAYYDKHRHLAETQSPKIVLVGGSNLVFGLDSQQIVDRLHLPVVNMSLHASLGLPLMLAEVKGNIHAGDIVIVSPEYELFAVDYEPLGLNQFLRTVPIATQYKPDRILPVLWNGLAYPRAIPVITARVHAALQTPAERADVNNDANLRADFDPYGDYTRHLNQPSASPDFLRSQTRTLLPSARFDAMIAALNTFDADVRAQGARTFYLFPPLLETQYLKNTEHIASIEQQLRQQLTFPIINSPGDYIFPAEYHFDTVYHLNRRGRELHTQQVVADLTRALGTTLNLSAEDADHAAKIYRVPVRSYAHAPALHTVGFGDILVTNGRETQTVASGQLQPWQIDADRTITSDIQERNGPRTIALDVRSSATDPWMAPINLDLTENTALTVPVTTNTGNSRAMDEQVALMAEVRGPGGETALFTSLPAQTQSEPQTLQFTDLFRRAGAYAHARNWPAGSLTVTRVGLELGWQIPISRTTTDTQVTIETGDRTLPDGPETYGRLAADAQRRLRGGNANGAIDAYTGALLLRPNDLDGQLALGDAFRSAKRWHDGIALYDTLSHTYPDDPWLQYGLATMQRGLGDLNAADATLVDFVAPIPVIANGEDAVTPSNARITATRHAVTTPTGTTYVATLEYDTGDGSSDQIYVSVNGGPEMLAATGPVGKGDVPAYPPSTQLRYRIYAGTAHTTLLGSVVISYPPPRSMPAIANGEGAVAPSNAWITATRHSVTTSAGTTDVATLEFDTGDGSSGQVYVSVNGRPEALVATGPVGKGDVPVLPPPGQLIYRLYAGTDHMTLLGSVVISYPALRSLPPRLVPWVNLLQEQLLIEGDVRDGRLQP